MQRLWVQIPPATKNLKGTMGYNWPNQKVKKNKYSAVATSGFPSKLEAVVYQILLLRQKAGEIKEVKNKDTVDLGFGIDWKVDFSYLTPAGEKVWVEAKGVETDRYRICLKLWRGGQGPGLLEIWKGSYRDPFIHEVVKPKGEPR